MKLSDINHEIKRHSILLTYLCDDGSLLKKWYVGYSLSEAKRKFHAKYKNIS